MMVIYIEVVKHHTSV